MPVILPKELESFWLDDEVQDPLDFTDILSPYSAEAMQAYEVSPLVNRPSNKGSEVAIPVGQESPSSGTHQAQWRCSSTGTMRPSLSPSSILSN